MRSTYFTVDEFRCHSGEEYPPEWVEDRLAVLCEVLDVIRSVWGGPLHVVSGYRSPAYNARLREKSSGVAENSQHPKGTAADIRPDHPTPANVAKLHGMVLELYRLGRIPRLGGLGLYPGWIHVDVRERPAGALLARWTGAGVGSEPVA